MADGPYEMVLLVANCLKDWQIIPSPNSDYTKWGAPWHVVDGSTAEPEVNWPGELIAGPYDSKEAARRGMAYALLEKIGWD